MAKNYEEIEGWCGTEITRLYDEAVSNAKDGSVFVEMGCYKGKSTCYMIDKIIGSNKKISFFVVDNFSTEGYVKDEFLSNLGEERCKYMHFIEKDSVVASEDFSDKSVDFIFIDTDHRAIQLKREITAWIPKMKPDGVVSGHDFHNNDMKDALDDLNVKHYQVNFAHQNQHHLGNWRGTSFYFNMKDI